MLERDYTSELIGLQGVNVGNICEVNGCLEIRLSMMKKAQRCPRCGESTGHIHDYRTQRVKDLDIRGIETVIVLSKKRYVCKKCGKRFQEENEWLPKYLRRTKRVTEAVVTKLRELVSYTHVAKETHLSINTVQRIFDAVSYAPKTLGEVLLIDEFKGNAGNNKYQCILMNPKNHEITDILPDRDKSTIVKYLKGKNTADVRYMVSDMWEAYRDICCNAFRNTVHITDRYHVCRQITWAMDSVRKDEQRKLNKESRIRYKHCAYLLEKQRSKLTYEERDRLNDIFFASPKLETAYRLKEEFISIMKLHDREAAKEQLGEWCCIAVNSGIERFIQCAKMVSKWSKSILNSIEFHNLTNGMIEGMNNKIKVLKRTAFGVRNFKRFRNRILHTSAHS